MSAFASAEGDVKKEKFSGMPRKQKHGILKLPSQMLDKLGKKR